MASFQKTLNTDVLSVRTIYARGPLNTNIPAFRVLATDGLGGTSWLTLSTLTTGGAFHRIITTTGTYTADASGATFSLLDTNTAGIAKDPTASNTAFIYAKAFGQIDISGSNSILAYNNETGVVNKNLNIVGTNGISVFGDPQTNTITFDGGELPFISSAPYSFSKLQVYSNAPTGTILPSTFSSIIIDANSPSSILRLVGVDPIQLTTNYAENIVNITVPLLTTQKISTLLGQQDFLLSTSATSRDLSTMSTTYGSIASKSELQSGLSSLSTGYNVRINQYSTSIGSIDTLRRGISTVYQAGSSNLLSTSFVYTSDINSLYELVKTDYVTITGSTIRTPYFWASTVVTLVNATQNPITTPGPTIGTMNANFYPTYSSIYNKWNDTSLFGQPSTLNVVYPTSVSFAESDRIYSTFSTTGGTIFSSLIGIKGEFTIYASDPPGAEEITWRVDWSGALQLSVGGNPIHPILPTYPRSNLFVQSTTLITIDTFTPYTVQYVFLKDTPNQYIRFSNTQGFSETLTQFISLDRAYGYNTNETPLFSSNINTSYPIGFSTFGPIAPYNIISTYVMVASTFYTDAIQTTFPVSTSGFASFGFFESATSRHITAFQTNIDTTPRSSITQAYNLSNVFGYNFTSNIPTGPRAFEVVFGKNNPSDNFRIGGLYLDILNFNFADVVFVSSFLWASTISSFGANINIVNANALNVSSINGDRPFTLSNYQANISSFSTSLGNVGDNIALRSGLSSLCTFVQVNLSSFSTSFGAGGASGMSISTLSTTYSDLKEASTLSTFIANIAGLASTMNRGLSTFSSIWSTYVNNAISSFSTAIGPGGASGSAISTLSTTYSDLKEASTLSTFIANIGGLASSLNNGLSSFSSIWSTYVNNAISSFSTALGPGGASGSAISTFSTSIGPVGGGSGDVSKANLSSMSTSYGDLKEASTLSTLTWNILLLASTVTVGLSSFSTSASTLRTTEVVVSSIKMSGILQPVIQYGWDTLTAGSKAITFTTAYTNSNYAIQLTYRDGTAYLSPPFASNITTTGFTAYRGNASDPATSAFSWTTFGAI